jgi:hypothetical protein
VLTTTSSSDLSSLTPIDVEMFAFVAITVMKTELCLALASGVLFNRLNMRHRDDVYRNSALYGRLRNPADTIPVSLRLTPTGVDQIGV